MEHTNVELGALETRINELADGAVVELSQAQLMLVGGGVGEVVPH